MITPIETRYKGYRFRSRLEARWAVFLDHLDIPWQYEPQGYVIDGEPYLPDFLVYPNDPVVDPFWLEIKPTVPTPGEMAKAQGLATGSECRTFVYYGPLEAAPDLSHVDYYEGRGLTPVPKWDDTEGWVLDYDHSIEYPAQWEYGLKPTAFNCVPPYKGRDHQPRSGFWWWTDCPYCGKVLIKLQGQVGWCPTVTDAQMTAIADHGDPHELYPYFQHRTPRLLDAYTAARSARFEHGETP